MSDAADPKTQPRTLAVEHRDAAGLHGDLTRIVTSGRTFVATARVVEPGTPVHLKLGFPGLLHPLEVSGYVSSRREGAPGTGDAGVEIAIELAYDDRARLLDAAERIRRGDPALVGRAFHVLVVEDNPHVSRLIQDGLAGTARRTMGERFRFRFSTAVNGLDALEALRRERPDCLIIDVYLPVLDGLQVIAEVRKDPALAGLPIMAMSAGGPSVRPAALAAGADRFLDKPMRLADVLATVKQILGEP